MENEEKSSPPVGQMHKHKETMPDGNRYIIFYTFGDEEKPKKEVEKNV